MSIAYRHWCQNESATSGRHDRGDGKPKRKRCGGCGSGFVVTEGGWGVVAHSGGTGRYNSADVVRWFTTERKADEWIAANDTTGTLVSRWFTAAVTA